jgi:carbonic anhydrase
MNRRHALKAIAGLALCPICTSPAFTSEGPHWSYAGQTGPNHWHELDAAARTCAIGTQQSPLDIGTVIHGELPDLGITWNKPADTIVNNGHTIQLNFRGAGGITVGPDRYRLLQLHFHRPSEHLVNGTAFAMEAHFVHATPAGALGVVAVMMATGRSNPVFNRIVATMPTVPGPAVEADTGIDPNGLLPQGRGYFAYAGSLTTPPCSETVSWMLLTNPIEVSETDVAAFARLYPMNARPAQKPNRRFVLRSG